MREHPSFQLRSAEFTIPEIIIVGYPALECPELTVFG